MVWIGNLNLYKIPSFGTSFFENLNRIIDKSFFDKIVNVTYIKVLFISNMVFNIRLSSQSSLSTSFFMYIILINLIIILVIIYQYIN